MAVEDCNLPHPVVVIGAGPSGLLTSLCLAEAGIDSIVCDEPSARAMLNRSFDGRALALVHGSRLILERFGLWSAIAASTTPVWSVWVRDEATGREIRYDAAEVGDHPFAYGIENRLLARGLLARALDCERIRVVAGRRLASIEWCGDFVRAIFADGSQQAASLIVGADGRNSAVRRRCGIVCEHHDYCQIALIGAFRHQGPHDGLVREYLRPAGPLALLPIGEGCCSFTWTERPDDARLLLGGGPHAMAAALERRVDGALGAIELRGPPASYPLQSSLAQRWVAPRVALVGDAAHGLHPIHAQGFNLAVRDSATLADELRGRADPGGPEGLLDYERRRRPDAGFMFSLTDGLNRLFSTDIAPARMARSLGLTALDRVPVLKQMAMRRGMGLDFARSTASARPQT